MSTNAAIIVEHRDGHWKRVTVHWDGYLSSAGRLLIDHYSGQDRAELLVAPGDLVHLGPLCGPVPPGPTAPDYTVYRGCDPKIVGDTLIEVLPSVNQGPEFIYIWRFRLGWYVMTDRFTPLDRALAEAGL